MAEREETARRQREDEAERRREAEARAQRGRDDADQLAAYLDKSAARNAAILEQARERVMMGHAEAEAAKQGRGTPEPIRQGPPRKGTRLVSRGPEESGPSSDRVVVRPKATPKRTARSTRSEESSEVGEKRKRTSDGGAPPAKRVESGEGPK